MTTVSDITRTRGDTYPIECQIFKSAGVPYDLTAVTEIKLGLATKKTLKAGETPSLILTGTVSNPKTDGKAVFTVTAGDADLEPETYFGEIKMLDGTFVVTTKQFIVKIEGNILNAAP